MISKLVLVLFLVLANQRQVHTASDGRFPDYFKFGTATASYQVEGAWNEDGKSPNIWDHICHTTPQFIDNSDNGDVACDSYHKYKEDVALLKELGVDFYRFSLSWSRILPYGIAGSPVNQAGVDYYRNLLQELIDNNIEPMVTIYHWDLPQILQEYGGFPNEDIVEHFAYYARIAFEQFGDVVKLWTTFNEPLQTCHQGYGTGTMAPGYKASGLAEYQCAHNVIKAHAKAYHIYDEEFRDSQQGIIGIAPDTPWHEPATDSEEDQEAAERALQFTYGWYFNAIAHGDYPEVMRRRIDERSQLQGFRTSRLPKFTEEEVEYIKGTYDYVAINAYTTYYTQARQEEANASVVDYDSDLNVNSYQDEYWEGSGSSWLKIVPWGLRKLLNWLSDNYNHSEIFITENGFSDSGRMDDLMRVYFFLTYLRSMLDAIYEDGVNVTRYTAWSLMDNFEWARGYTEKFGLYSVNFSDPERPRTPKMSRVYYAQVISERCIYSPC